jgi:hypothetical protein
LRPNKTPQHQQKPSPSDTTLAPIRGANDGTSISSINELEAALKNLATADTLNASVLSIPVAVEEYEKPHKDLPSM